ncbi:hypothetical protein [Arcticibacterium luteifluviistationis]|uniref:hypothetical protein n=1 Tax=Arcticibacterium luteifluviistationis TaxID=1784714 RepID=UPI0013A6E67F|nr:hypothetical protein [Arcticibacterium luteifluviistationis]
MPKCTKCQSTSFKMTIENVNGSNIKFRVISCYSCDTVVSFLDFTNNSIAFDDIYDKLAIRRRS